MIRSGGRQVINAGLHRRGYRTSSNSSTDICAVSGSRIDNSRPRLVRLRCIAAMALVMTAAFASSAAASGPQPPTVDIAAGAYHTCAILDNGDVSCWGFGGSGRLGYGNSDTSVMTKPPAAPERSTWEQAAPPPRSLPASNTPARSSTTAR